MARKYAACFAWRMAALRMVARRPRRQGPNRAVPDAVHDYPCASCGDEYAYDVSAQIDGLTYMVDASSSAPPLPARLEALIEALQAIIARPLP